LNPAPPNGNLGQDAAEQIPAEWTVLSVAETRPMDITIRAETFREWKGRWPYKFPGDVVIVEEAARPLYLGLLSQDADLGLFECAIAKTDEAVIAVIHEDWQKQRAETKKLLGFLEYRAPSPEFAVMDAGGVEFCRIKSSKDKAESKYYTTYHLDLAGVQYRLQETSGSVWSYNARWGILCGDTRMAETSRLAWNGAMLQRVELSLMSSVHLPPAMLLMLTWWIDEKSKRRESG
jgi:hypothetical protein